MNVFVFVFGLEMSPELWLSFVHFSLTTPLTMKLFGLLSGAALAAATPTVEFTDSTGGSSAHGSITFDSTAGLTLHASKCIDRSSWCGRYKRFDCAPSNAAVVSALQLSTEGGAVVHSIQLRADGVLDFSLANGGCVMPVESWVKDPEHSVLVLAGASSKGFVAASSVHTGIVLHSASGFAINGDTIDPECKCANGKPNTDACMAHLDDHCATCDVGFYLAGKLCAPFTVCQAGTHETTAPAQTTQDRLCSKNAAGTFTASAGQLTAAAWSTCAAGQGATNEPSAIADRTCAGCVLGTSFSTTDDGSACERVRSACAPGTHVTAYATASSDMSCGGCGAESFSATFGAAKCEAWKTCPVGQGQIHTPSTIADRTCAGCVLGTSFSHANAGLPCQEADRCVGGEYERTVPTTSSDRDCSTHSRVCNSHEYVSQEPSATQDRVCKQKACHCPNGDHTTGDACPKHGDPKCSTCVGAFHLANNNNQCDANTCSCIHGAVAFGAACTVHGTTKCTSCNGGYHMEGENCVITPVNGNWGGWSSPGACSVAACGRTGTRTMTRSCNNPAPAHGGAGCAGSASAGISCSTGPCPVDGTWGGYWGWTGCSKTCGGGTQSNYRQCYGRAHGGRDCVGSPTKWQSCNPQACQTWRQLAGIVTVSSSGGDWHTQHCPPGKYIVGGGCFAASAPYIFRTSAPAGNRGWQCGGHGGRKTVTALCSNFPTTVETHNSGADWAEFTCNNRAMQILGGGCSSLGPHYKFQASYPSGVANPHTWRCGGHGGAKTVSVICAHPGDIKVDITAPRSIGDWGGVSCPGNYQVIGGGCNARTSPFVMSSSSPQSIYGARQVNGWQCGGHGGNKQSWAMCAKNGYRYSGIAF
jgi:hypothetical protein